MTERMYDSCPGFGRRTLLSSITSVAATTIAGCEEIQNGKSTKENSQYITTTAEGGRKSQTDLVEIIEDINSLYSRLSEHPIIEDSEFVFRLKAFEDHFDQKQMFSDADIILERLERQKSRDMHNLEIEALISSTELAKLLTRQRGIIHQIIATGLVFHKQINQVKHEEAADAIQKAQQFVISLRNNIDQIIASLKGQGWSRISIDEFDPHSLRASQKILAEICLWTELVYKGLDQVVQGIKRFEDGNSELESERYKKAGAAYKKSQSCFETAIEAFDRAQGRGKQLPHLIPVMEGMRCLMPAYIYSSRKLAEAVGEVEVGNEEHARKIAREALVTADKKSSRCF